MMLFCVLLAVAVIMNTFGDEVVKGLSFILPKMMSNPAPKMGDIPTQVSDRNSAVVDEANTPQFGPGSLMSLATLNVDGLSGFNTEGVNQAVRDNLAALQEQQSGNTPAAASSASSKTALEEHYQDRPLDIQQAMDEHISSYEDYDSHAVG